MALSDGMGSGEKACRESTLVMELLEELLEAGFPAKAAIQMINTTSVSYTHLPIEAPILSIRIYIKYIKYGRCDCRLL